MTPCKRWALLNPTFHKPEICIMHSTETKRLTDTDTVASVIAFDALRIGQTASASSRFTAMDAELCCILSGDCATASGAGASRIWVGWLISDALESLLPGAGKLHQEHRLQLERPVQPGEVITAIVTIAEKHADRDATVFNCNCTDKDGEVVAHVRAELIAGIGRSQMIGQSRHEALLDACAGLPPVRTAVVHPHDDDTLASTVAAAEAGLIEPVLIGHAATICSVAAHSHLDLRPYHLIGVEDNHTASETAVTMARAGKVEAIVQGSLDADDLLSKVAATETNLPETASASLSKATIVVGIGVPIILAGRGDTVRTRLTSCATASLLAASFRTRSLAVE